MGWQSASNSCTPFKKSWVKNCPMSLRFNKCSRTKWENSEGVIPGKSWESSQWHHDARFLAWCDSIGLLKFLGALAQKPSQVQHFRKKRFREVFDALGPALSRDASIRKQIWTNGHSIDYECLLIWKFRGYFEKMWKEFWPIYWFSKQISSDIYQNLNKG